MTRRRGRYRGHRNHRFWLTLSKLVLILGIVGLCSYYAYEVGRRLSFKEIAAQSQEVERLVAENTRQREDLAQIKQKTDGLDSEIAQYKQTIQDLAPNDDARLVAALVKEKLSSGIDAKYLIAALQSADALRTCRALDNKRVSVATDGLETMAKIGDGLSVAISGKASTDQSGFDASQDIALRFVTADAKDNRISGKLPLYPSVISKTFEYRLSVTPAAGGVVNISGQRCDYNPKG